MSLERQNLSDFLNTRHTVTLSLGWATAVACLGTLQFGYHLAELNGTQLILSGNLDKPGPFGSYEETFWYRLGLVQYIPIEDSRLSVITTMFTVGGLISSILVGSNTLSILIGRKINCMIYAFLFFVGSLIMTFSNSFKMLNVGRLLCGLGAGSSVVISPILINELTPTNHRGFLGSFLQLSLAIGILFSNVLSVFFANDQQWRAIFMVATIIGFCQFALLFTIVESPKWLIINKNDTRNATSILTLLRSNKRTVRHEINHWRRLSVHKSDLEATPLLDDLSEDCIPLVPTKSRRGSIDPSNLLVIEFMTSRTYRKELIATVIIMSGNQLCGMNAITFYGVFFLEHIVPKSTNILILTSCLALCNVISAMGVAPLFDKFGRKPLLLFSAVVMIFSTMCISMGLLKESHYVTAIACFVFIIGYSFGIGPIVYLMVPEFTNQNAIAFAQSFGTVINWISNIIIAYYFPYFNRVLGSSVFFIFTAINTLYLVLILMFVPETKGLHDYQEVWDNFSFI